MNSKVIFSSILQTNSGQGSFLSGFASSLLGGVVAETFSSAHTAVKTAMAAISGGTASRLGGGKFASGAMGAAFVMLFNDLANSYPSRNKMKSLTINGWKYGKNGRYRTWVVNGIDTENSQYAASEYYNGESPSEKFFNGMGNYIVNHPDGIGLTLSTGAVISSGGLSFILGSAAIGIDLVSQDWLGAGIGTFAILKVPGFTVSDIGYGIYRVEE